MQNCAAALPLKCGIFKAHRTNAALVTHDQEVARTSADKIGLMYEGQLEQWDTPDTYTTNRPVSSWRILSARTHLLTEWF
ncbi:MAG: hypothetical protein EOP51_32060 [Sphingobacteriales bacterium]|nr:MAG: hypothetical protein EOP51_32060 [Sphingobacteriales bacterium]